MAVNTSPLEYVVTCQVAEYLKLLQKQGEVVCYSHIPQETYTKSWSAKRKNKNMGVIAGVPDMLIVYPHKVLFLELKREKGNSTTPEQKEWISALKQAGVEAEVAKGFNQAKEIIDKYKELLKQVQGGGSL